MSDYLPASLQLTPPRVEWTKFSQGLCQLIRDSYHYSNNSFLAESIILGYLAKLRHQIIVQKKRYFVRYVVIAFEFAPADAFIIIIDAENVQDLPDENASDYELWKWARRQPEGVRFIPIDAKLCSLTIGRKVDDRNRFFYSWTKFTGERSQPEEPEVVFAMVEGIDDFIAIMPAAMWVNAADGSYGLETLTGEAPLWIFPFMVHLDDLEQALDNLIALATTGATYVNPTTNDTPFKGWKVYAKDFADLDPSGDNSHRHVSFTSTLKLWKEIEDADLGCWIEFNSVQPCIFDFYVGVPDCGLLRFEFKEFTSLDFMLEVMQMEPRSNPFSPSRMWEVLYLKLANRFVCITRDELRDLRGAPSRAWIMEHAVDGFPEALKYIRERSMDAKAEVKRALCTIRPVDVCPDVPHREVSLKAIDKDPLEGHTRAQLTLPWVSHMLNTKSMQSGYGVCLPLGAGGPVGTHVIVDHEWSVQNQEDFRRNGKLPLQLWHRATSQKDCVILRMLDLSPHGSFSLTAPLTFPRSAWRKPVENLRYFLIIGSTLPHELHRTGNEQSSDYLVLPSQFTALSNDEDLLPMPPDSDREKGAHYSRGVPNATNELRKPVWPNKTSTVHIKGKPLITTPDINPLRYILNLADGSINRQFRALLQSHGTVTIDNPKFQGTNTTFAPEPFKVSVGDVRRATWLYGYERDYRPQSSNPRPYNKKQAKEVLEEGEDS